MHVRILVLLSVSLICFTTGASKDGKPNRSKSNGVPSSYSKEQDQMETFNPLGPRVMCSFL